MIWLSILAAVIGGLSDSDVIFVNDTGLAIARIYIDSRMIDSNPNLPTHAGKALISVTPTHHDLRIVFRGGAEIKWPRFNFQGIHELFIQRDDTNFVIRTE